jgi:transcriptional regulator with XRE-family HTH domain
MITGPQIKAARALLGWSVPDLARRAGMEIAEIQEIENARRRPKRKLNNAEVIQATLEDAGIELIDSVGVQFRPKLLLRSFDNPGSG